MNSKSLILFVEFLLGIILKENWMLEMVVVIKVVERIRNMDKRRGQL